MHLQVVVVSTDSQIASIETPILRGDDNQSICPWISAAHLDVPSNKSSFYITSNGRKFGIEAATSYYFVDVRRVHLWLALDAKCVEEIKTFIMHNGPTPSGFYRGVFPDPIVSCGFEITPIPSTKDGLDRWITSLVKNFEPWRQRIWDAFRDSS
jgi:hypothetical protein